MDLIYQFMSSLSYFILVLPKAVDFVRFTDVFIFVRRCTG